MLKKIRPYWRLIYSYPLHFLAAYFAAMICNFLLTLQPGFVRVFINEANRGVEKNHLVFISLFMILAMGLAFIFDTLQVTIALEFKLKVEKSLRYIHQRYCQYHSTRQINLTIQKGIFGLVELTVLSSLELLLVISNIVMISFFMLFEDRNLGLIVFALLFLGVISNLYLTRPLGRIAKFKEILKGRMIKNFQKDESKFSQSIMQLQKFEHKRFLLDTFFVFVSFTIFKLVPSFILITVALYLEKSVGSIASLFLYFNLLHKPFLRLMLITKQVVLYYSQSSLFRDGIEAGLTYESTLHSFPYGLFVTPLQGEAGAPLSNGVSNSNCIYRDDVGKLDESDGIYEQLLLMAKERPILIYSDSLCIYKKAHFYFDENSEVKTMPCYLMEHACA